MALKLRPLQLPILVEQRKKMEEAQIETCDDHAWKTYATDASSAAVTPVTPTFSYREDLHSPDSRSSFDISPPASVKEPSSPSQLSHKSSQRSLHDVSEESADAPDVEHEELASLRSGISDCLSGRPCIEKGAGFDYDTASFYADAQNVEYDISFMSDGEHELDTEPTKKRRGGDSHFTGLSHRISSKLPSLSKWKFSRQASLTSSPISDHGGFERTSFSRATSSRASSISEASHIPSYQNPLDRKNEPPLPPTPALSFYDSRESVAASIHAEEGEEEQEFTDMDPLSTLAQQRALAQTPLLPLSPLISDTRDHVSGVRSPPESPDVIDSPRLESSSPVVQAPVLSSKPSNSSFHHFTAVADLHNIPAPDAWSDRLGHANFTILPQPYTPEMISIETLNRLRSDWDTARVNYTKHLVRTGEHYGETSTTYEMTEAKWAEVNQCWRDEHDLMVNDIIANGIPIGCVKFDEGILTAVPRMDTEGKFPERGDEDIVGPMDRKPSILGQGTDMKKNPSFWRHLAGRVGIKK